MKALHHVLRLRKSSNGIANITLTASSETQCSGSVSLVPQAAGTSCRSRATHTKLNSTHDNQIWRPPAKTSSVAKFSDFFAQPGYGDADHANDERNQQNAIWNTVVRHLVHDEMSNALPEVGDEQRKDRR